MRRNAALPPPQLRQDAEAALARRSPNQALPQHADASLHELQVHQIELEMQNETLRLAQLALEDSRQRYFDLYEFAPVACLTLTDKGLIKELNLSSATLLGGERGALLHGTFADFVVAADRDRWRQFFLSALHQHDRWSCELTMLRGDGSRFEVRLDCKQWIVESEAPRLRVALTDITENRKLVEECARQAARRVEISRHLAIVQEEERRRLALEVHDVVSPNLAVVEISLGLIQTDLPQAISEHLQPRLNDLHELIRSTNLSLRAISANLRPTALDYAGLYACVEDYAQQFSERTGINVRVTGGEADGRLPGNVETLLFRIVQEALTNCAKHAQATRITIELGHDCEHACLEIADDGIGFDPETLIMAGHRQSLGLLTMGERAELAGGQLRLVSHAGQGTRITVEI